MKKLISSGIVFLIVLLGCTAQAQAVPFKQKTYIYLTGLSSSADSKDIFSTCDDELKQGFSKGSDLIIFDHLCKTISVKVGNINRSFASMETSETCTKSPNFPSPNYVYEWDEAFPDQTAKLFFARCIAGVTVIPQTPFSISKLTTPHFP